MSRFLNISSYSLNMVTMIGLAVGIDYTLFIVERFREERANGLSKLAAIERSGNTASRAVLFSGITVIVAMSGLLIVPDEANIGLVVGAISVVFAAVAIALTLLPATLSLLGDRVNWGSLPGRKARKSGRQPERRLRSADGGRPAPPGYLRRLRDRDPGRRHAPPLRDSPRLFEHGRDAAEPLHGHRI